MKTKLHPIARLDREVLRATVRGVRSTQLALAWLAQRTPPSSRLGRALAAALRYHQAVLTARRSELARYSPNTQPTRGPLPHRLPIRHRRVDLEGVALGTLTGLALAALMAIGVGVLPETYEVLSQLRALG